MGIFFKFTGIIWSFSFIQCFNKNYLKKKVGLSKVTAELRINAPLESTSSHCGWQ